MYIINQMMDYESKKLANVEDIGTLSNREALCTDEANEIMPLISAFVKFKNSKISFETPIIETGKVEIINIRDNKIFTKQDMMVKIPIQDAKQAFVFDDYLKINFKDYAITLW